MLKWLIRKTQPNRYTNGRDYSECISRVMRPSIPSSNTEKKAREVGKHVSDFFAEKKLTGYECYAISIQQEIILTWHSKTENGKILKIQIFEDVMSFKLYERSSSSTWIYFDNFGKLNRFLLWLYDIDFLRDVA